MSSTRLINKISHPCHFRQFTKSLYLLWVHINMFSYLMSELINSDDSTRCIVTALCFAQESQLICLRFYYLIIFFFLPSSTYFLPGERWGTFAGSLSLSPSENTAAFECLKFNLIKKMNLSLCLITPLEIVCQSWSRHGGALPNLSICNKLPITPLEHPSQTWARRNVAND